MTIEEMVMYQRQNFLMFKQILPPSTTTNNKTTVRRIYMLILGLKVIKLTFSMFLYTFNQLKYLELLSVCVSGLVEFGL